MEKGGLVLHLHSTFYVRRMQIQPPFKPKVMESSRHFGVRLPIQFIYAMRRSGNASLAHLIRAFVRRNRGELETGHLLSELR
jgi:hypothetical protein